MTIDSLQSWREPIAADWRRQAAELAEHLTAHSDLAGRRLRRLAAMRLGYGERLRLRRLVRQALALPTPLPGFRLFRLLLASNRTLGFLAADIEAAGAARGLLIETVETEFDAVRSLALDPAVAAPPGRFDASLLLVDADFFSWRDDLMDEAADSQAGAELDAVIAGLRAKAGAPVIVATLALPPEAQISSSDRMLAGAAVRRVQRINAQVADLAEAGRAILFDLAGVAARIGGVAFFDPVRFHQAKVPFSLEVGPAVADSLAALIAAMTGRSGRALVLDLDNTLWGGIVADDGIEGVAIGQGSAEGEAFLALQQHALELRRRGIVLAVCSKNLEEAARGPFRTHPDMLLREQHFAAFVANFDDKATNLARIAERLDLDPSSLVFLDDNPAERERVRSALPFVLVPELGDDPAYFIRDLNASGFFEHLPLTADDTRRAAAYQARAEAKALQATIGDYDAYLRSLDMELTILPFDATGRARIAQLIQKSNQFNLTTRRYSEVEIAAIEADPRRLGWQARLEDRFADHGMIAVVIVDKGDAAWAIDSWVMSCRVLQRGVERALMNELARLALESGAQAVTGEYRPTARNALVKDFYPKLGFEPIASEEAGVDSYRIALSQWRAEPTAIEVKLSATAP